MEQVEGAVLNRTGRLIDRVGDSNKDLEGGEAVFQEDTWELSIPDRGRVQRP